MVEIKKYLPWIAVVGAVGVGAYLLLKKPEVKEAIKKIIPVPPVVPPEVVPPREIVPVQVSAKILGVGVAGEKTAFKPGEETPWFTARIKNTGLASAQFAVGMSIGYTGGWYDRGYYLANTHGGERDDYSVVTLGPGQEVNVGRKFKIPDDSKVSDIWATVKNVSLTKTYDSLIKRDAISVTKLFVPFVQVKIGPIGCDKPFYAGKYQLRVGYPVTVTAYIANVGNVKKRFAVGMSLGHAFPTQKWYDVGYYIDRLGDYFYMDLSPKSTLPAKRQFKVPDDTSITDVFVTVRDAETLKVVRGGSIVNPILKVYPY